MIIGILTLVSCSKTQFKLNDGSIISKEEITKVLMKAEADSLGYDSYDQGKYSIKQYLVEDRDMNDIEYLRLKNLSVGKIAGPYLNRDSTTFFIKKQKESEVFQYLFRMTNVHQPAGLSDDFFQEELDHMKAAIRNKEIKFMDLRDKYDSEYDIQIGYTLESEWSDVSELLPEVGKWITSNPVGSFYQSAKQEFPRTTYLTFIQKADQKKIATKYQYLTITLNQ